MRDLVITAVFFIALLGVLRRPHVGIYVWSWLSYMNPHRLTWGFAYDFPFSMIGATVTVAAWIFSKEPKRFPFTRESVLLLAYIGWMFVTTTYSLQPDLAWEDMNKVLKIQFMVFLTMILIYTRERIHVLIWIIVLSLGFYGFKGGIFTALQGGVSHVFGPSGTFIGGNNELALALVMIIPLMRYLHLHTENKWIKRGIILLMLLSVLAVIGSQSRGALLGAAAMGGFLWLKSSRKLPVFLLLLVAALAVLAIMPQQWFDRMESIQNYEQDESAQGRINAWNFAYNLALDRPLVGGGFESFRHELFKRYAPNPLDVHDAHSIYFETLGEHGFVGLLLFLLLGFWTWRSAGSVMVKARGDPALAWMADLAAMIQVGLIGYFVTGAFLGLAKFDLYFHFIAIVVVCKLILRQRKTPDISQPIAPTNISDKPERPVRNPFGKR